MNESFYQKMADLFLNSINENPFINAKINGSNAIVCIYGRAFSYPDIAASHMQPFYDWLDQVYSNSLSSMTINFNIPYIGNEVYFEHFISVLKVVNIGYNAGVSTTLNWYYSLMFDEILDEHDEYLAAQYIKDAERWGFEFNLIQFTDYDDFNDIAWPGFLDSLKP